MHQKVLIALVALLAMGLLLSVGVWAYDDAQKDQIAPGVKVGGVDVGGRDADSARKIIENQVVAPLRQPVVVSYDGKEYTLSPKRLHEKANVDGMVQEAPGEPGRAVDVRSMTAAMNDAARSPGRDQAIPAVVKTTKPEINKKDL